MNVIEERPVPLPTVAAIMKEREADYVGRSVELLYEQRRALDHAVKFSKISEKDAQEMTEKLSAMGLTMTPDRIVKIVDLMPKSVDDIRAIFAKERFKYTEEEIKSVIEVVDQYR